MKDQNEKITTENTNCNPCDNSKEAKSKIKILGPNELVKLLINKLVGDHKSETVAALITTAATCIICYFYLMLYGLGCPDTLCEGLRYYRNADYSTSQARWMIRFLDILAGKNVIIPALTVSLYCLMIGIASIIICRMMKIEKTLYVVLLTATMVSFPVISHQFAYLYMALAYSFAFLMVIIGVALVRTRKLWGIAIATLCFLMMMGSYQSYISAVAAFAVIKFMYDAVTEEKVSRSFANLGFTALAGLLAAVADMPFSKLMMRIYHTGTENRVSEFSFESIKTNLSFSLEWGVKWFFSYFDNEVLSRDHLYTVIFIILILLAVILFIYKLKNKKFVHAIMLLAGALVMPTAMNFTLILIPTAGVRDLMRYQYVLIFALLLFFHSYIGEKTYNNIISYASVAAIVLLLAGNAISANCTTFMYKYSYDYAEKQALLMLEEIYDIPEYVPDETPIVMGGAFSYTPVKDRYPMIFRYAEQEGGLVFWINTYGMISCRYHFFQDFMGVETRYFSNGEYEEAVRSEEYANMPCWPEEGSVQMIGDKVVIKIYEVAPD